LIENSYRWPIKLPTSKKQYFRKKGDKIDREERKKTKTKRGEEKGKCSSMARKRGPHTGGEKNPGKQTTQGKEKAQVSLTKTGSSFRGGQKLGTA